MQKYEVLLNGKLYKTEIVVYKTGIKQPPRVEYSLTETGKTLMPTIQLMIDWAQEHFEEVTK